MNLCWMNYTATSAKTVYTLRAANALVFRDILLGKTSYMLGTLSEMAADFEKETIH